MLPQVRCSSWQCNGKWRRWTDKTKNKRTRNRIGTYIFRLHTQYSYIILLSKWLSLCSAVHSSLCSMAYSLSHTHTPSTQPNGTFGQIWRMHSAVIAWALGAHHIIMHTDSAVHLHLATTTLAHILQCWPKKNKKTHTHTAEWVWAAKLHWIPYMMEHCGIIWLENAWMHFWNTSEN